MKRYQALLLAALLLTACRSSYVPLQTNYHVRVLLYEPRQSCREFDYDVHSAADLMQLQEALISTGAILRITVEPHQP